MPEKIFPQRRAEAHRRRGGKILGSQAAGKTHRRQKHQQPAALPDIHGIRIFDTGVDNTRHHKGNEQFKAGFQHFK